MLLRHPCQAIGERLTEMPNGNNFRTRTQPPVVLVLEFDRGPRIEHEYEYRFTEHEYEYAFDTNHNGDQRQVVDLQLRSQNMAVEAGHVV